MRKIILGGGLIIAAALAVFILMGTAGAGVLHEPLGNEAILQYGGENFIVTYMPGQNQETFGAMQALSERAAERSKKYESMRTAKETREHSQTYRPSDCDSDIRPRQWVQSHCGDKLN